MKNANFGQGKRVPQHFTDYVKIVQAFERTLMEKSNGIQLKWFQEYRDTIPETQVEQAISEEVINNFMNQIQMSDERILDQFDNQIKDSFEPAYIHIKRLANRRQVKQVQKRNSQFQNTRFDEKFLEQKQKVINDFMEYFDEFLEKMQLDMESYLQSKPIASRNKQDEKTQNFIESTNEFLSQKY